MAVVYRPHRHLLVDSMKEMKVFDTVVEIVSYVIESFENWYTNIAVYIDNEELDDERIGWHHTRYVLIVCEESDRKPMCVGMCDLDSFVNCAKEEIYDRVKCRNR